MDAPNSSKNSKSLIKFPTSVEFIYFAIIGYLIYQQWKSFAMIVDTDGSHGFGSFLTCTLMISSLSFGVIKTNTILKIILFSSYLLMSIIHLNHRKSELSSREQVEAGQKSPRQSFSEKFED